MKSNYTIQKVEKNPWQVTSNAALEGTNVATAKHFTNSTDPKAQWVFNTRRSPLSLTEPCKSTFFKHDLMKIILPFVLLFFILSFASCSKSDDDSVDHQPATLELIALADQNPEFKSLLIKSIEIARIENPDKKTNPAQNLDEFYLFIDWACVCMPWDILKDQSYPLIYEQIDQSLDYFYFAIDRPLPELEGLGLYRNSLQYYEPFRSWMIEFIKSWGAFLSTTESWNNDYYLKALQDQRFGLDKGWYEDPSNWKTFNQFFSRYLKSPDQRPISSPGDASVIVSPADAEPQGVWGIDNNSDLITSKGVAIKSSVVYSISDLLGEGSAYQAAFANGILTHTFLNVQDYHRFHFPVSGTVLEMKIIAQDDAVGGIITWSPEENKYLLNDTVPGWQFIETRGYMIVQTENYGVVALMPIGMSQVSSVNFEDNVHVGDNFTKGDPMGYFLFGGSDFVMLFQEEAGFQITAPDDGNGGFQHLFMGEAYGKLTGAN
ncbi:MAG: phosphatidylserine decarboxylase [Bacteroidales bacterium]|nr:phosphatidylserine decarboxylase [Bacteroidales bacterium]